MSADLYSRLLEKRGDPHGYARRPAPLHPQIPVRQQQAPQSPQRVIERPHLAGPNQNHGGLKTEPPVLDSLDLRRYNFHGTTGAPLTPEGQQMSRVRKNQEHDEIANVGSQYTHPRGRMPPPVPEEAKQHRPQPQAQPQPQPQAQPQPQPQAQPQPQPQAQPQAQAPTSTWGDHVNSGMNHLRSGAQNAQRRAASGWNSVTPENQAALQGAANTAKTWGGRALKGGLGAGAAYAGYRMLGGGGQVADEQNARMQDYLANAQHQMSQPLPSMTVMASYDSFAAEKLAALHKRAEPVNMFQTSHGAMAGAFGKALADKLVTEPIDNAHRFLKKKIIDDPKAHSTFHEVIKGDPMLNDAYAQNPEGMEETFKAMRKFGPSMTTSPAVVRSFLRQSTMTGGNMDFATIRLLAETEKFVQNSRGQGR